MAEACHTDKGENLPEGSFTPLALLIERMQSRQVDASVKKSPIVDLVYFYLFQAGDVSPLSVCLFVCLSARLCKK